MPEGHSLRRLALAFERWFVGSTCTTSSPQGRFTGGAAALDGMVMAEADSVGKHLFLRFSPAGDSGHSLWLHVHLGLYGSWRFYGTPSVNVTPSIGAPRLPDGHLSGDEGFGVTSRDGEVVELDREDEAARSDALATGALATTPEGALSDALATTPENARSDALATTEDDTDEDDTDVGDSGGDAYRMIAVAAQVGPDSNEGVRLDPGFNGARNSMALTLETDGTGADLAPESSNWTPPPPRGAVRLRIVTDTVAADLSGPTQCEVLDAAGVEEVLGRLGPDPLDHETDPDLLKQEFIRRIRSSRRTVGELVMDQSVAAGVGNIYRAEALFRQGISPHRKGANVSAVRLGKLWDDFVYLLNEGVVSGRIRTLDPDLISEEVHVDDTEAKKWFVYKRAGQPCLSCGAPVKGQVMAGRNLFWCSSCQR